MSFDAPEPPHRHRIGGLPAWLEWVTAISALIISVASIVIAIRNGETESRLVQATSYPYLDQGTSNALPDGTRRFSVDLMNHGVGPAHEQSLRIKVGAHYATSLQDLVTQVVGPAEAKAAIVALHPYTNTTRTRFIPANTTQFIFQMTLDPANERWWHMLDQSSQKWSFEVCYCSVFKECWDRLDEAPPQPVKACKRDEATEFKN